MPKALFWCPARRFPTWSRRAVARSSIRVRSPPWSGYPTSPPCAAKGAVVALTRSMAVDLAQHRIRVNVICPGTVYTPLMEPMLRARGDGDLQAGLAKTLLKYPIGRLGTPEDIAPVALFLACDDASFLTGSTVTADGGMTAQ